MMANFIFITNSYLFISIDREYLPTPLLDPIVEKIGADLDRYIPQPFADELRGISKTLGMSLGDIVLANIVYDISAFNSSGIE